MEKQRTLVLLDNGSSRARSTLSLRRLAADLGERIAEPVHPVSLMHADKVPMDELDGRPADTFAPFLRARTMAGARSFLILPLFFGPSRALTEFVPAETERMSADLGPLDLQVVDVLCPLPDGEPLLAEILHGNILQSATATGIMPERVVLVDHGSPNPEVAAVRRSLAMDLRGRLGTAVRVEEASMERRAGAKYNFNGDSLDDVLRRLAEENRDSPVTLSMLFMFAGRHAGPGGDVERIYRTVEREYPGFQVHQSALVGEHPSLVGILQSRLEATTDRRKQT